MSPFSWAAKILSSFMVTGFRRRYPFKLFSMATVSPWIISGRLRLFSSSTESLCVRVIGEATVAFAIDMVKVVFSPSLFFPESLWLREFFAPLVGTHTHLYL